MTTGEALLVIGGALIGFAVRDIWTVYRAWKTPKPTRPVVKDWDSIQHVRIIK